MGPKILLLVAVGPIAGWIGTAAIEERERIGRSRDAVIAVVVTEEGQTKR
jgi:hypothetical protein